MPKLSNIGCNLAYTIDGYDWLIWLSYPAVTDEPPRNVELLLIIFPANLYFSKSQVVLPQTHVQKYYVNKKIYKKL